MTWIKYSLFFIGVFFVFLFIAAYFLFFSTGVSAGVVGWWMDYDDEIPQIAVFNKSIGFYDHGRLYELKGHWTNKAFYAVPNGDSGEEVAVAKEISNEDLEVEMRYFNSSDTRVLHGVKTQRTPDEYHPYPVGKPGEAVSYPPPKGMIKVGMLEADLATLPWKPYSRDEPQYVIEQTMNGEPYNGSRLVNGWPHVWCFKSDDPNLPDLRVTVEKGRVTEVIGGAEDTSGPSYVPPTDTTTVSSDDNNNDNSQESWVMWLFDLFFRK